MNPTEIIDKKILVCDDCNSDVHNDTDYVAKHMVDVEIRLIVREERVYTGACVKCGKIHVGAFSKEYKNPVQYGNNIKILITILNGHGYVSINKTRDILNSITGNQLNISDATIVNIQNSLSNRLKKTLDSIKSNLIKCKVLNADETGYRVNGKTNWVQVFSNNLFTLCGHNSKRGSVSIEGMGVLDFS